MSTNQPADRYLDNYFSQLSSRAESIDAAARALKEILIAPDDVIVEDGILTPKGIVNGLLKGISSICIQISNNLDDTDEYIFKHFTRIEVPFDPPKQDHSTF